MNIYTIIAMAVVSMILVVSITQALEQTFAPITHALGG